MLENDEAVDTHPNMRKHVRHAAINRLVTLKKVPNTVGEEIMVLSISMVCGRSSSEKEYRNKNEDDV